MSEQNIGDSKLSYEPTVEVSEFGMVLDNDNGSKTALIGKEPYNLYTVLDEQFGDGDGGDEDDSVTTKELFDYQADVLHDCYKEQFGDEDNGDSGPATELLTNMDIPSMNTQTIEVDGRPLDELFTDHGRVMADNDRDHDRVVTMSDVDAEIQSLCERVTELENDNE